MTLWMCGKIGSHQKLKSHTWNIRLKDENEFLTVSLLPLRISWDLDLKMVSHQFVCQDLDQPVSTRMKLISLRQSDKGKKMKFTSCLRNSSLQLSLSINPRLVLLTMHLKQSRKRKRRLTLRNGCRNRRRKRRGISQEEKAQLRMKTRTRLSISLRNTERRGGKS